MYRKLSILFTSVCQENWTLSKVGDNYKCTQVVDIDNGVNSPEKMYRYGLISGRVSFELKTKLLKKMYGKRK